MSTSPQQTLKGYQIHEQIGVGGFGAVYRAFQPVVEREVAIKVILAEYANQPEFIRRFEAEAHLIARLEHPNIVPLYDYWRDPDGAYLVLRWLRGGNLTEALKNHPYEPHDALKLLDQICSALAIAHRNNVVHRDIKPDNILLDEDGNAYLTDFGISTIIGHTPDDEDGGVSGTIRYIAPEQLMQEPDAITIDIYSLGIVLFEILTGSHPFEEHTNAEIVMKHLNDPLPPVQDLRPELPDAVDSVIQKATAKNKDDRYQSAREMSEAFRQVFTATIELDDWAIDTSQLVNPFKGLRAFEQADSGDFFGRKLLIERLVAVLETDSFVAVVGPSGSGKSSVVKAGLLPALRDNAIAGSDSWFYAEMTPDANPYQELEAVLLGVSASPAIPFTKLFEQSEHGISTAIQLALPTQESALVLVIDQFEEMFTLVENEDDRKRFLHGLLNAVNDTECHLKLIITLRADFYDRPLLYPKFGELVRTHIETVLPLSHTELEEAITYPIVASGAIMEAGLPDLIIQDVEDQPGALPLLQYALTELFERHDNGMLTIHAYNEIGGVLGALANRAEQVFSGLDQPLKDVSRQLFLRLVTLGDSANDTRRRVRRDELTALDTHQLNAVLDVFGRARLLTFDRDPISRTPTVEVAHEALIHRWGQLQQWIDTSREDIRLHRRLMTEAQDWLVSGRDAGFLVTDSRLEQYADWSNATDLILNADEKDYLSAAIERRDAERKRDEARKERELELQQNANQRLRVLVASLIIFLIVAIGLSGFAFVQRGQAETARATSDANFIIAEDARDIAERQADEANSLALAAQSMLEVNQYNLDLAIALGLQANSIDDPPIVSQNALRTAAYSPATRHRCQFDDEQPVAWRISPNGQQVLVSSRHLDSSDSTFTLYDIPTCDIQQQSTFSNELVAAIEFIGEDSVFITTLDTLTQRVAQVMLWDLEQWTAKYEESGLGYSFHIDVSDDGQLALIDYVQQGVVLWDISAGEARQQHSRPYYISTLLADGQRALSANQTGAVLWDTESGEDLQIFESSNGTLTSLTVSPDEKFALGGTEFAALFLWDLETGEIIREFLGHSEEVYDLAFLANGKHFLSASQDNSIRLWDVETGTTLYRFDGHRSAVRDIVLLPEQNGFVSWSLDNTARVWDLYNASQIRRYTGHPTSINALAIHSHGTMAVTGDIESGLYLWDLETNSILHQFDQVQFVHRVTFSPDENYMLTSALNGLFLHEIESGELVWHVPNMAFTDAQYSPDAKLILGTAFFQTGGGIALIDPTTGDIINGYNNASAVYSGDFAGDSDTFAFSAGNTACLWDKNTGQEVHCFIGHEGDIGVVRTLSEGQQILTASNDGTIRLWDTQTGQEIRRFVGHSAPIISIDLSDDETQFVSGSADSSIRVWDVEAGEELRRVTETSAIFAVAFMPNNQFVLAGAEDGSLIVWDVSQQEIQDLISWVQDNRYVESNIE